MTYLKSCFEAGCLFLSLLRDRDPKGKLVGVCLLALIPPCTGFAGEDVVIESARLRLQLKPDLNGCLSIQDRATGREYAATRSDDHLYRIALGKDATDAQTLWIDSRDAEERSVSVIENGLVLRFTHGAPLSGDVICRVVAAGNELQWRIEVENQSDLPISAIQYPRQTFTATLGERGGDDALIWPAYCGTLLHNPGEKLTSRVLGEIKKKRARYPGKISTQLLYFFDPKGGFYIAAHDSEGNGKQIDIEKVDEGLRLGWQMNFSSTKHAKSSSPYPIVWTTSGGAWTDGASVYRTWSSEQPWAQLDLKQKNTPEWLRKGSVFIMTHPRKYRDLDEFIEAARRYRTFFNLPIVICFWGWEREGIWAGPEYFPPVNGFEFYQKAAELLNREEIYLHIYNSGFRWTARALTSDRPPAVNGVYPREYTSYDSRPLLEKQIRQVAQIDANGEPRRPHLARWGDVTRLCAGSKPAFDLNVDLFRQSWDMGVSIIDLDQDLGGEVAECYAEDHGHPPGNGEWQYKSMADFLNKVRGLGKERNSQNLLGLEEPCELYLPQVDLCDSRPFGVTTFPVESAAGSGSLIPLFTFLYHPFQVQYGWGNIFTALGNSEISMGLAFIYGMPVSFERKGAYELGSEPSPELGRARRRALLVRQFSEYLLEGVLLGFPKVEGVGAYPAGSAGSSAANSKVLPAPLPYVQVAAWKPKQGERILYAVANISPEKQNAQFHPMRRPQNKPLWKKYSADSVAELDVSTGANTISLELEPWEICVIQESAQ